MLSLSLMSLRIRTGKEEDGKSLVCDKREGPITYVLCGDLHLSES